jgi:hypothetical protein
MPSKDHVNAKYCCNKCCSLVASTVIFGRSEVVIMAQKLTILRCFIVFLSSFKANGGRLSLVRLSTSCHTFSSSLFANHPTSHCHIVWCH